MKILGIDCGIAITGWAVVEKEVKNCTLKAIEYGTIKTDPGWVMPKRLSKLYNDISEIIEKYDPCEMALEDLFYFKNKKTIISVGQARGVIILSATMKNLKVISYTPLQVKQAVTGYGKATKDQVKIMTKSILKLKELPKSDDAADALAICICHLNTKKFYQYKKIF